MMSIAVESLFTTALGLQAPWVMSNVDLNTVKRRIDFEVKCDANKLPCPACGVDEQGILLIPTLRSQSDSRARHEAR